MATREVGRGIGFNLSSEEGADIERFDQNYKLLQTAIKSSQISQNYYGDTAKVEAGSGGVQRTVLVLDRGDNLAQARQASINAETRIAGMNAQTFGGVNEIPFRVFEGSINLKGDEAKRMLQSVVEKFGGQITKTLGDEVFYTYALDEDLVQKFKKQKKSPSKKFETKAFKEAQQASLSYEIEQAQKEEQDTLALQAKQEEKQKELEDKKQKAYEQKERRAYNLEQQRIQRQIEQLEGKLALDGRTYAEIFEASREENAPVLTRKEELEEYKRIEAEDKKAKEEQSQKEKEAKEAEASRRRVLGTVLKVIGAVTLLTNIARRILTAVLSSAEKAREDTVIAHNLGTSYQQLQYYGVLEKAHGMKEGTLASALQDIQNKFGNLTNLDEKAVGELARVMGSEIQSLVLTGMGGDEPDKLMEKILDKYFLNYKAGKNSIGQYVGQEQARRELVSALNKVSPALSSILATMIETNQSGVFKGKVGSFKDFKETVTPHRALITDIDASAFQTLGQEVKLAGAEFKKLIQDSAMLLTAPLHKLTATILHSRIGMSDLEKRRVSDKEFKEAKETVTSLTETRDSALGGLRASLKNTEDIDWKKWQYFNIEDLLSTKPSEEAKELMKQITTSSNPVLLSFLASAMYADRESKKIQDKINKRKAGEDFYFVREDYTDEVMELAVQEEIKRFLGIDSGKSSRRGTTLGAQFKSFARGSIPVSEWQSQQYSEAGMWVDFEAMKKDAPELYSGFVEAYNKASEEWGSLFSKEGVNKSKKYAKRTIDFASKYFYGNPYDRLTDEKVKSIIETKERAEANIAYYHSKGMYEQEAKARASSVTIFKDYERLVEAQRQAFAFESVTSSDSQGSKFGEWLNTTMAIPYLEKLNTDYALANRVAVEATVPELKRRFIESGMFTEKQLAGVANFNVSATQDPSKPQHWTLNCTFIDSSGQERKGSLQWNSSAGVTSSASTKGNLGITANMQRENN